MFYLQQQEISNLARTKWFSVKFHTDLCSSELQIVFIWLPIEKGHIFSRTERKIPHEPLVEQLPKMWLYWSMTLSGNPVDFYVLTTASLEVHVMRRWTHYCSFNH